MRLEAEVQWSVDVIFGGLILDSGGLLAQAELVQEILMVEADIGRL